jgi:hypothetical protein
MKLALVFQGFSLIRLERYYGQRDRLVPFDDVDDPAGLSLKFRGRRSRQNEKKHYEQGNGSEHGFSFTDGFLR